MSAAVEKLKSQASTLSVPERAELACFLLSTLEVENADAQTAWRIELGRRVEDIHGGTAIGRPVVEVLAELKERYL